MSPSHLAIWRRAAPLLGVRSNDVHTRYCYRFAEALCALHPEADAVGMSMYLQREDKKTTVIDNHGEEKWRSMLAHLEDPDKILWTYSHVLPNFLNQAVEQLYGELV